MAAYAWPAMFYAAGIGALVASGASFWWGGAAFILIGMGAIAESKV